MKEYECMVRLAFCCLAILFSGCAESSRTNEPETTPVAGTVLLDGEPIPAAQVLLIDLDATPARTSVFEATQGKFSGRTTPGKKRVEIRAYRNDVVSDDPGSPPAVDPQYLPAKYNSESTLTAEIGPAGEESLELTVSLK